MLGLTKDPRSCYLLHKEEHTRSVRFFYLFFTLLQHAVHQEEIRQAVGSGHL